MYRLFYSRYWAGFSALIIVVFLSIIFGTVIVVGEMLTHAMDRLVRYILAFIVVNAAFLVLLISSLVIWKFRSIQKEKTYESNIKAFRDLLASHTAGEGVETKILQLSGKLPFEFLQTAGETLQALRGSAQERLQALVLSSRSFNDLLRHRSSRSPQCTLQALSLLPFLSNDKSNRIIENSLSHPSPMVRLAAQITSLSCGSDRTKMEVLQRIPRLPLFDKILVYLQFPYNSSVLPEFLKKTLNSKYDEDILCALELILIHEKLVPVLIPSELAKSPNTEIRIKFFKVFHLMPLPDCAIEILRDGLTDDDWRVRAMSARACGLIGMSSLTYELLKMVIAVKTTDEARHAAKALVSIGGEALRQLDMLRFSGKPLVHRIVSEAIEKQVLLGLEVVR